MHENNDLSDESEAEEDLSDGGGPPEGPTDAQGVSKLSFNIAWNLILCY